VRVLARNRNHTAYVLLSVLTEIVASESHSTRDRVEKPQQEVDDGRLSAPTGADDSDLRPRLENQVEAFEHQRLILGVAGAHTFESDRRRAFRCGAGCRRVAHRGLTLSELEHAAPCGKRGRQLLRGERKWCHRLERGEREEREHGDEHPIEVTGRVRRDRDGEHGRGRRSDHHDRQPVRKTCDQRIAPIEARGCFVGVTDTAQHDVLLPVHHELRRTAEQLDKLRREASSCLGTRTS
jgi:hypothetical protein